MKNKITRIIILTAVSVLVFSMNVLAAPKTMPDGQKFDPQFYAATYPDVVAALGTDENVLYAHYLNNGKAEGRLPYAVGGAEAYSAKLQSLKSIYPEGTPWTNETREYTVKNGSIWITGLGCAAFAFEASDFVFGKEAPYIQHYDYNNVKVGDILRINHNTHSVVVMEIDSDGNGYTVCEGNYNRSVHWGRHISKANAIDESSYIYTRY